MVSCAKQFVGEDQMVDRKSVTGAVRATLLVAVLALLALSLAACVEKPAALNDNSSANSNAGASASPSPAPSEAAGDSATIGNANASTPGNTNTSVSTANSNAKPPAIVKAAAVAREPERYSETATISIQMTGNDSGGSLPSLQYDFAKSGAD